MYEIIQSNNRGGKAGKGCNKTSSLRVVENFSTGFYRIVSTHRFNVDDVLSYEKAMARASEVVEQLSSRK